MDERQSARTPISDPGRPPLAPAPPASTLLLDQQFTLAELHAMRMFVVDHAHALGLRGEQIQALELVASELMTNAIEHAGGAGRLRLWASDAKIYCQVSDAGPGMPPAVEHSGQDPSAPRGRGLWLVTTFADSLSVDHPDPPGAVVTAVFNREPAATRNGPR